MVVDSSMLAKHTEQISINEVARLGGVDLNNFNRYIVKVSRASLINIRLYKK